MPYMQKKQNTTSQNMGYRPLKVEQLFLSSIIPKKSPDEQLMHSESVLLIDKIL